MAEDDGLIYGDTDNGFIVPAYEDTNAWVGRRLRKKRGDNIVLTPKSFWGGIKDFLADALHLCFQIAGAAHDQNTFKYSRGVNVDLVIEPLGTKRLPATYSTTTLTLYGTAGTNLLVGRQVRSTQITTPFATTEAVVIPAAPSSLWVIEIADGFAVGTTFTLTIAAKPPIVKVAGGLDTAATIIMYLVAQADAISDVSSRAGGSSGGRAAAVLEDDGLGPFALTFVNTGPVVSYKFTAVHAAAQAAVTGPVVAQARTLRQILTPVGGWSGVFNELDADLGADQELDAPYKARHRDSIQAVGGSSTRAVRDRVKKFGLASYARVIPNKTDFVVDGLLPHSIRVIVEYGPGATALTVGQAILDAKSAGDNVNGSISTFPLNEEGEIEEMKHDVVEPVYLWVYAVVTPGEKFPVIGEPYDAIAEDIVAFGDVLGVGFDVDTIALPIAYYLDGSDRGVKSAEVYLAATATELPAPTFPGDYGAAGESVEVDFDQRAIFDTSRITVEPAP